MVIDQCINQSLLLLFRSAIPAQKIGTITIIPVQLIEQMFEIKKGHNSIVLCPIPTVFLHFSVTRGLVKTLKC